jgi:uncharacterized protein YjbI with pentapeptide repeats
MRPNGIECEPRICGSALRLAAAPLLEELWFPDQARLKALLDLSIAHDIKLSDCLEALFPDKDSKSALAHFRSFRKRINDAAARRGIALQCDLDQKRRSAPDERHCWFSSANPAAMEVATSGNAVTGASIDVLNFIGLLLGGELCGASPLPEGEGIRESIDRLNHILGSDSLPATTLAFRYWLHAIANGLPVPAPRHVNLAGADVEGWTIRGRSLDQPLRLRGANLEGARLNRARLENVDLTSANLKHLDARECLFLNVTASHADLTRSDLRDLKWRAGSLAEARLRDAKISGAQWIDVDLTGAAFSEHWEREAAIVDRARMESRPIVAQRAAQLVAVTAGAAAVTAFGFSPDGRFIVSGANDGTLRVWNADTGKRLQTLAAHTQPVALCRFTADGRQILSAARTGVLKVWDAESGELQGTQPRPARSAGDDRSISTDGRRTASVSDDGALNVSDAATATCLWTGYHFPEGQSAALDVGRHRILFASAEAWRFLAWRAKDPATGQPRLFPAEFFGPLSR